jgi:deoxyribonuclease V
MNCHWLDNQAIRHDWRLTPPQAVALQMRLARLVSRRSVSPLKRLLRVAGVDVSYERATDRCHAAVVVYDRLSGEVLEEATRSEPSTFPYVPGLLSFRELPPLLEALRRLHIPPDVILADAQGIAHPRRLGAASHLGLWTGIPTVGCAKSILVGQHNPLDMARGSRADLRDLKSGETLGAALRTRAAVAPVYVSVGHRISLEDALALVLACTPRYRLPEPIRQAHHLSNRIRLADTAGFSAKAEPPSP